MKTGECTEPDVCEEQLLYAKVLAVGMYAGLVILVVTFALYLTGLLEPAVPIKDLPAFWTMNVDRYLDVINAEYVGHDHALRGWWWLSALGHGDYLNFVGIAVLSMVTVVCFIAVVPTLVAKRDWIYATMAMTEVVILALAASGILMVGD